MACPAAVSKAEAAAVLAEEQARQVQQEKELATKEALRKPEVELELKYCEIIAQKVTEATSRVWDCRFKKIWETLPLNWIITLYIFNVLVFLD